ncbi:hypothetical protein N2384_07815 [Bacillus paralicheniformis]|uniref:hypothetical protein n=1 Tax=Bacillus paralicheniformis TaxID=1648923 RepID=UPI0021A43B8D|nr:hypothetical protein [Bacillus paralicheniformis]UWS62863.1 hypothetical protein N2384_07815 [Bacillus paralicheniformis]
MVAKNDNTQRKFAHIQQLNLRGLLHFVIPSLLGLLLFVIPVPWNGEVTVPIAFLTNAITQGLAPWLPGAVTIIIVLAWLGTAYTRWLRPAKLLHLPLWNALFNPDLIRFSQTMRSDQ